MLSVQAGEALPPMGTVQLPFLKAVHMLDRQTCCPSPGEWRLHPQMVQMIWNDFDLFSSEENSHCTIFFSRKKDVLPHKLSSSHLYAFPLEALLPQVIRQIKQDRCSVLLVTLG